MGLVRGSFVLFVGVKAFRLYVQVAQGVWAYVTRILHWYRRFGYLYATGPSYVHLCMGWMRSKTHGDYVVL
jgi:hypothetical protein